MRHLKNITGRPPDTYKPPPKHDCHREVFYTYPTGDDNDGQRIVVRMWVHRGKIVDFAINQVIDIDGKWKTVARIDCCGGQVHRHQYDKDGKDLIGHQPIRVIPPVGGEDVVNEAYKQALQVMHDEYDDNLGRWNGDHA